VRTEAWVVPEATQRSLAVWIWLLRLVAVEEHSATTQLLLVREGQAEVSPRQAARAPPLQQRAEALERLRHLMVVVERIL